MKVRIYLKMYYMTRLWQLESGVLFSFIVRVSYDCVGEFSVCYKAAAHGANGGVIILPPGGAFRCPCCDGVG